MTKEIYHEGWLIKSPPTKRIWRARWRRRWFTLKQGEIPEQFCLEYYTDRNCRKLKGVIDLDQCEQVDSGLQLEHRKQKFEHMFDVKTPRRTYYLAADSEEDMNAWVNCICEVCNLQDLSKHQQQNNEENRQYYNVGSDAINNQPTASSSLVATLRSTTTSATKNASDQVALLSTAEPVDNNNSVYQNYDAMCRNSSAYNNRETLICDAPLSANGLKESKEDYYNFTAIANEANRLQSTNESLTPTRKAPENPSVTRKIPENLKLNDSINTESTSLPTSHSTSGPYIAISECISGNPLIDRENPMTPLNSLDPKFYDTPRSHFNIGLNLTNEQPYSPKRNNVPTTQSQLPRSGKSSPTDDESVFSDDEDWMPTNKADSKHDRSCRPSESSIENDSIVFTYAQRFSKLPFEENSTNNNSKGYTKRTKRVAGLMLEKQPTDEQNKEINSSDTENASPAIAYGPKDINSCVDESYDIPRSHHLPYMSANNENLNGDASRWSTLKMDGSQSKRNSVTSQCSQASSATLPKARPHYYTNAAPTKVEGNVFRYDFDEKQSDAPVVDRKLKPKLNSEESETKPVAPSKPTRSVPSVSVPQSSSSKNQSLDLKPPCIDRKLKPTTPIKYETNSLHRKGLPINVVASGIADIEFQNDFSSDQLSKTLPRNYNNSMSLNSDSIISLPTGSTPVSTTNNGPRPAGVLDYFDLDHSNPPPICKNSNTSASTSNLNTPSAFSLQSEPSPMFPNPSQRFSAFGASTSSMFGSINSEANTASSSLNISQTATAAATATPPTNSGIVYKFVDFIKTEAFMRTRQDAELARAKNRSKE